MRNLDRRALFNLCGALLVLAACRRSREPLTPEEAADVLGHLSDVIDLVLARVARLNPPDAVAKAVEQTRGAMGAAKQVASSRTKKIEPLELDEIVAPVHAAYHDLYGLLSAGGLLDYGGGLAAETSTDRPIPTPEELRELTER